MVLVMGGIIVSFILVDFIIMEFSGVFLVYVGYIFFRRNIIECCVNYIWIKIIVDIFLFYIKSFSSEIRKCNFGRFVGVFGKFFYVDIRG